MTHQLQSSTRDAQSVQFVYIQSALTDSARTRYVLNIQGATDVSGTPVIIWPWQIGALNALWSLDASGMILCPLGSGLALGLGAKYGSGNVVVAVTYNPNDPTQFWSITEGGTIVNQSTGMVLNVAGGVAAPGTAVITYPVQDGPPANEIWSIVYPQAWVPQWSYLQSPLTDGEQNVYVLGVQSGSSGPGAQAVLSQQQNATNQLWLFTPDGRLLNNGSGYFAVSLGASYSSGSNENYLVLQASAFEASQQWTLQSGGMITNNTNALAMSVAGGQAVQNAAIITSPVQSGPPPNEIWYSVPSNSISLVMAQAPVPFPPFQGDEATAYAYINSQLKVADVRQEYLNLGLDLGNMLVQIIGFKCPANIPPDAWDAVVTELSAEIPAASDVRNLFEQYFLYHTELNNYQNSSLEKLGEDAGMEQGDSTSIGGIVLAVFQGIAYTVLEAIPGEGALAKACAVLGNVMVAGISTAIAASNAQSKISPSPFSVAYSELLGQLSSAFANLLTTLGNMETTILTDWGKMQAIDALIKSTGPDSLSWAPSMAGQLIDLSSPGYDISVMQMLLPAKFQIYVYETDDDTSVPDVPDYAQWIQSIGGGVWRKYWIATPDDWSVYPSVEALQNDLWDQGASKSDFFQGQNGWGFAVTYPLYGNSIIGVDQSGVIVTLSNQTPNQLNVTISAQQGTIFSATNQVLPPFGSVAFTGLYNDGCQLLLTVSDPLRGSGIYTVVGSCLVNKDGNLIPGDVWVSNANTSLGYAFVTPICNTGSGKPASTYPASAQIGICLVPINS